MMSNIFLDFKFILSTTMSYLETLSEELGLN